MGNGYSKLYTNNKGQSRYQPRIPPNVSDHSEPELLYKGLTMFGEETYVWMTPSRYRISDRFGEIRSKKDFFQHASVAFFRSRRKAERIAKKTIQERINTINSLFHETPPYEIGENDG